MNCTIAKKLIHLYLDNEIDEAAARALEDHASGCPSCRAEFLAIERLALAVESLPRVVAPAGFTQQTMYMIAQHKREQPNWLRNWPGISLTITLVVLGLTLAIQSWDEFLQVLPDAAWDSPADALYNLLVLAMSMEVSLVGGIGLLTIGGLMGLLQLIMRSNRMASPAVS